MRCLTRYIRYQVRVRVLSVDAVERKLVLSMRQKPRPAVGDQGDVSKYSAMLKDVSEPAVCFAFVFIPL